MGKLTAPVRIWATVNGARASLPDGKRYLIGGWESEPTHQRGTEYVRADIAEDLTTAYMAGFEAGRAALKETLG